MSKSENRWEQTSHFLNENPEKHFCTCEGQYNQWLDYKEKRRIRKQYQKPLKQSRLRDYNGQGTLEKTKIYYSVEY